MNNREYTKQAIESRFNEAFPGTIHHSYECQLGPNCKRSILEFISQERTQWEAELLEKILKDISQYATAENDTVIFLRIDKKKFLTSLSLLGSKEEKLDGEAKNI